MPLSTREELNSQKSNILLSRRENNQNFANMRPKSVFFISPYISWLLASCSIAKQPLAANLQTSGMSDGAGKWVYLNFTPIKCVFLYQFRVGVSHYRWRCRDFKGLKFVALSLSRKSSNNVALSLVAYRKMCRFPSTVINTINNIHFQISYIFCIILWCSLFLIV